MSPGGDPRAQGSLLWPLARSAARLPWAMAMWSVQQAVNLARPTRTGWRTVTAFDALSRTAKEHMGETVAGVHRTGEHLQDGMIETVSAPASRGVASPRSAFAGAWEALVRPWTRSGSRNENREEGS